MSIMVLVTIQNEVWQDKKQNISFFYLIFSDRIFSLASQIVTFCINKWDYLGPGFRLRYFQSDMAELPVSA